VGFDHLLGHLEGGFDSWKNANKEIDTIKRISSEQFAKKVQIGKSKVIDVRKESEYKAEHIEKAFSRPLSEINHWIKEIDVNEPFYLHCAGGYRSMMAASILQARGFRNFTEIEGGFQAISQTNIPKSDFVCQSKVLREE
jgi:rhodanese-related sulfurtransferase